MNNAAKAVLGYLLGDQRERAIAAYISLNYGHNMSAVWQNIARWEAERAIAKGWTDKF